MGRKKAFSYDPNHKAKGKGRRRGKISTDVDATELTGSVIWYAPPTVPEGHQLLVIDGYTMGRTTEGNSTPQFIILPTSSAELIDVVNRIPGIGASATTEAGAYAALASSNACYVASFGDSETTVDGLVLELDASKKISYPGTGNTWYDTAGDNKNWDLSGPSFNSDGWFEFDGTNDYAGRYDINVNPDTSDTTVEMIFKAKKLDADQALFTDNWGPEYGLWIRSNGNLQYTAYTSRQVDIDANKWYHAVFSIDPGATKNSSDQTYIYSYLNGSYLGSNNANTGNGMNDTNFRIGIDYRNGQNAAPFSGSIALCRVYNRKLTADEVKQNYYDGPIVTDELKLNLDVSNLVSFEDGSTSWYDMVNSNNSASLVGNVDYSTTYNGTLNVDGSQTSDYIILPHQVLDNDISSNGAWSLECWLRMDNTSGTTYLFSTAIPSTTNGWIIQKNSNTIFPWNESLQDGSAISFTAGETFHLTLTINGSSIYLYKNGSYIGRYSYTKSIANATGWVLNQEQDALLGGFDSSQATDMGINIIRVYNKTLSASEVGQNFEAQRSRFGL